MIKIVLLLHVLLITHNMVQYVSVYKVLTTQTYQTCCVWCLIRFFEWSINKEWKG